MMDCEVETQGFADKKLELKDRLWRALEGLGKIIDRHQVIFRLSSQEHACQPMQIHSIQDRQEKKKEVAFESSC